MSLADVESIILGPMQRVYLPPRNMDEGQQTSALREYGEALERFEAADLKAAWQAVRDTHMSRGWPVPAAFIMPARQSFKDRKPQAALSVADRKKQATAEVWDRWKTIRKTQMARDAVQRNVAWALKCAVLNDEKRAEEIDLRVLVMSKTSAERLAENLHSGEFKMAPGHVKVALDMWRTLQIRESETQQEILHAA